MSWFDHLDENEDIRPDAESLSTVLAKRITSKHNQHAMLRVAGSAGKGKSWLGLSLAYGVACEIAEILGGKPEDYFTMKNDLGCISKTEIKRVMTDPKPYAVKFLDDVAVAMNARKFKDEFNIDMNDLIQTFRPNHNLVVMTSQSGFLIDKVPRSLAHYLVEMEESLFDVGISVVKAFELEMDEDTGKIYRHYLKAAGCSYNRHICYAPPQEVTDVYEAERAIQLKRINDEKQETKTKEQTLKKKDYAVGAVDGVICELNCSIEKACKIVGIDPAYYNRLKT